MSMKEGYLHDYLAASFIGLAYGVSIWQLVTQVGDWGKFVGALVIAGIFGFIPSGFVAGYINFRLHRMGENLEMAGLSAGFFSGIVFTIIGLFTTLVHVIMNPWDAVLARSLAGDYLIGWIISVLFAFIFLSLGGYISGFLERRPFAMPAILDLSHIARSAPTPPPPPPPVGTQMCLTCGQPLTFIQQYSRWYCANCKKYP